MPKFVDSEKRDWSYTISYAEYKLIKAELGLDLYDAFKQEGMQMLVTPGPAVEVAWLLVKDNASQRNVSQEDFEKAIKGDILNDVQDCFFEAIKDFFPTGAHRKVIEAAVKEVKTLRASNMEELTRQASEAGMISNENSSAPLEPSVSSQTT